MSEIDIRPLTPGFAAEIYGLDLQKPAEAVSTVWELVEKYGVMFLRDQTLSLDELVAATKAIGSILRVPYVKGLDSHPDVIGVLKEADEKRIATFGGTWHSDFSFLDTPPSLTLLYAVELPSVGGDTLWANQYAAYETLSPGLQAVLDPLFAVHAGTPHGTAGPSNYSATSRSIKMTRNDPTADREVLHPVVRVHPLTRRKALFVNPVYTQRFADMTVSDSKPLLEHLYQHATRAELCCRWRWHPKTLAIWDNRCTMHLAINDYDGSRRLLYRTTITGETPNNVRFARQA
jgi:alpha-ketoglutarate-dependent taurine dioxygenase